MAESWFDLKARVVAWAREHDSVTYAYNAPYNWWRSALAAGIITPEQHDLARQRYGRMWNYVGD